MQPFVNAAASALGRITLSECPGAIHSQRPSASTPFPALAPKTKAAHPRWVRRFFHIEILEPGSGTAIAAGIGTAFTALQFSAVAHALRDAVDSALGQHHGQGAQTELGGNEQTDQSGKLQVDPWIHGKTTREQLMQHDEFLFLVLRAGVTASHQ
jgi:hypothetical protein